jgi:hypothetical protein
MRLFVIGRDACYICGHCNERDSSGESYGKSAKDENEVREAKN